MKKKCGIQPSPIDTIIGKKEQALKIFGEISKMRPVT